MLILVCTGMVVFFGHLYLVFFFFRGGKGVATVVGVLFGFFWPVALAALVTWLLMTLLFRISSLSALTAATLAPLYMYLLNGHPVLVGMAGMMSLLLLWRHRTNIQRLLRGEEKKIGKK